MSPLKLMPPSKESVDSVLASLRRLASKSVRDGLARFAIPAENAFGVSVGTLRKEAKRIGRNHELAEGLWKTGYLEARLLACFIDDPASVTKKQMDRWCRDFDNWAVVDTACFHLFDKTADAWKMIERWAKLTGEFQKRAAFALIWALTVHDKRSGDESFRKGLKLIERAATDDRNFVKKAVNMALRATGKRNPALHAAAVKTAERLAASTDPTARWNSKDALRELRGPSVARRLASRKQVRTRG
jgi:3-methyladenine DNA glycosylase AlkD